MSWKPLPVIIPRNAENQAELYAMYVRGELACEQAFDDAMKRDASTIVIDDPHPTEKPKVRSNRFSRTS